MGQGKRDPLFSPGATQVFHDYRGNSRRKNIFFELTKEQVTNICKENCYYCGRPPHKSNVKRGHYGVYNYNGIDRKNHAKGYTMDNIVPCCAECNRIRSSNLTMEEMKIIATTLKKFRSGNTD